MTHGSSRIAALDGLRAVSILLVLISHAWLGHIVPGGLGVTIFFLSVVLLLPA
jgi:peptidoglycan/LPS O-acetylase OafA/YrhL